MVHGRDYLMGMSAPKRHRLWLPLMIIAAAAQMAFVHQRMPMPLVADMAQTTESAEINGEETSADEPSRNGLEGWALRVHEAAMSSMLKAQESN